MSVFVNNLDDFIIPSQACINPLVANKRNQPPLVTSKTDHNPQVTSKRDHNPLKLNPQVANGRDQADGVIQDEEKKQKTSSSSSSGIAKISLQSDFSVSEYDVEVQPNLIKTRGDGAAQKVATVSLNDCLACSGCVTSAESVLIQEQSYSKLLDALTIPDMCVVVTLSPQSVASLAAFIDSPSVADTFLRLATYLKTLGVKYVFDAAAGGDVVLLEAREEFITRHQSSTGMCNPCWESPPTTSPHSSTHYLPSGADTPVPIPPGGLASFSTDVPHPLPVVASHCPGFICYAEKTTPQILPYVSSIKSAQQVIGTVLKFVLPVKQAGTTDIPIPSNPRKLFHVSVQPCFDKKLEGSRQDFFHEDAEVAEVDLVLSTTELWRLLEDSFRDQQEQKLPLDTQNNQDKERNDSIEPKLMVGFINSFSLDRPCGQDSIESLFRVFSQNGQQLVNAVDANASSGGFAEYLFKYAAERLYGRDMWSTPLQYKQGRNSDTAEVTLTHPESGKALLTFSRMYGFRNIQSLVLKMKRKRLPMMDYVELMACPSGCANGGGQIKTQVTEHPTEIAERVKKTQSYFHSSLVVGRVEDSPLVKYLYGVLDSQSDLVSRENMFVPNNLFRTTYHAIPKLEVVAPLAAKW